LSNHGGLAAHLFAIFTSLAERARGFPHKAAAECICLFALLFKTATSPQSARVLTPNAVLEQTPSKPPFKEQSVTEFSYSILLSSFLLSSDAAN
jgi:hypothetical protein